MIAVLRTAMRRMSLLSSAGMISQSHQGTAKKRKVVENAAL